MDQENLKEDAISEAAIKMARNQAAAIKEHESLLLTTNDNDGANTKDFIESANIITALDMLTMHQMYKISSGGASSNAAASPSLPGTEIPAAPIVGVRKGSALERTILQLAKEVKCDLFPPIDNEKMYSVDESGGLGKKVFLYGGYTFQHVEIGKACMEAIYLRSGGSGIDRKQYSQMSASEMRSLLSLIISNSHILDEAVECFCENKPLIARFLNCITHSMRGEMISRIVQEDDKKEKKEAERLPDDENSGSGEKEDSTPPPMPPYDNTIIAKDLLSSIISKENDWRIEMVQSLIMRYAENYNTNDISLVALSEDVIASLYNSCIANAALLSFSTGGPSSWFFERCMQLFMFKKNPPQPQQQPEEQKD